MARLPAGTADDTENQAAGAPADTGWATAVYYSGFTLTTLGVGEIVPASAAYRLLTIAHAGIGFATFTMAIAYFLSVYSHR